MTRTLNLVACGLVLIAGAALAKETASNPVVKARIDGMQVIQANTGLLRDMSSGKVAFDAAKAAEAKAALVAASADIPARFEAQETDPVSEALPKIWTDWADFTAKAKTLEQAATALDIASAETIKAGIGDVTGTCRACHSSYKD